MDTNNSKQSLSSQDENRRIVAISKDLERSEPIGKEVGEKPQTRIMRGKESNYFKYEKEQLLAYLKNNTATASMIEEATGIKHKNICRHKRELEKDGLLRELYEAPCKLTGFYAFYLTTDLNLMPIDNQIKLF